MTLCASIGACAAPGQAVPVRAAPVTEVIFYPSAGQSAAQQDRDRYECYLWAVRQSGFDPSQVDLAPPQQVVVRSEPPPGSVVAAAAITGAVIGAIVRSPHDAGEGAVIGAATGAVLGAAVESSQQAQVRSQYDRDAGARQARLDAEASAYRRAMSACLEGRGYAVR